MVAIRSGTIEAGSLARSTMGPTQTRHAHISTHAHYEGFGITYPKPATACWVGYGVDRCESRQIGAYPDLRQTQSIAHPSHKLHLRKKTLNKQLIIRHKINETERSTKNCL